MKQIKFDQQPHLTFPEILKDLGFEDRSWCNESGGQLYHPELNVTVWKIDHNDYPDELDDFEWWVNHGEAYECEFDDSKTEFCKNITEVLNWIEKNKRR